MSYENDPWCLETATISGAEPGEAGGLSAANYFLLPGEQRNIPSVGPFAGMDRGLRTGGHISDNPVGFAAQQVVRGGWISDE